MHSVQYQDDRYTECRRGVASVFGARGQESYFAPPPEKLRVWDLLYNLF